MSKDGQLSYPNFVRGQLFGGMQPSLDRLEVLNPHRWVIRKVLQHSGSKKETLLRNP